MFLSDRSRLVLVALGEALGLPLGLPSVHDRVGRAAEGLDERGEGVLVAVGELVAGVGDLGDE